MSAPLLDPLALGVLSSGEHFVYCRSGVNVTITSSKLLGDGSSSKMDVTAVGTEALAVTLCSFPSFHPLPGTKLEGALGPRGRIQ